MPSFRMQGTLHEESDTETVIGADLDAVDVVYGILDIYRNCFHIDLNENQITLIEEMDG